MTQALGLAIQGARALPKAGAVDFMLHISEVLADMSLRYRDRHSIYVQFAVQAEGEVGVMYEQSATLDDEE
jgi:hypothetical protein